MIAGRCVRVKTHEWADGRLLKTNRKWGQLKERQKVWMYETARKEYDRFVYSGVVGI